VSVAADKLPDSAKREGDASVLFARSIALTAEEPASFRDLNLDQVVAAAIGGREEYNLEIFFYTPLQTTEEVRYRHEAFRDLQREEVHSAVAGFVGRMDDVRRLLITAKKSYYPLSQQAWFLEAAEVYCDAVSRLDSGLQEAQPSSQAFRRLTEGLAAYAGSQPFRSLQADSAHLREDLSAIEYCIAIDGSQVTISYCESEPDLSVVVDETFARFKTGEPAADLTPASHRREMDHVEAKILELVARLFPEVFAALAQFRERYGDFIEPLVARFEREVQFYLAGLESAARLSESGLPWSLPTVREELGHMEATAVYDLALAAALSYQSKEVVSNDVRLSPDEQIIVVTGPNQGGKTTFARTIGQLHYLASIGWLVPAQTARVPLCDAVFTHFEREEDLETLSGKLEEDLQRVRFILENATDRSVVVMNESLTATALQDAVRLGATVIRRLIELGVHAVYVTFIDELATLAPQVVSMVGTVPPDDPAGRTYKVVRAPANGLAYAEALARKYGLAYDSLRARLEAAS
jgi:DNA mismatch repair protein MutS